MHTTVVRFVLSSRDASGGSPAKTGPGFTLIREVVQRSGGVTCIAHVLRDVADAIDPRQAIGFAHGSRHNIARKIALQGCAVLGEQRAHSRQAVARIARGRLVGGTTNETEIIRYIFEMLYERAVKRGHVGHIGQVRVLQS